MRERWLHNLFDWTPRGASLDSVWVRLSALRAVWAALRQDRTWLIGLGPDATDRVLQRFSASRRVALPSGGVFNEVAQMWLEYGGLGLLAVATFCWQVVPHLRPGDPWSAAWVIGAVLSLTHWPMRIPMVGMVFLAISGKVVMG